MRGKIGAKPAGQFTYDELLDENGIQTPCEVKVFPLLVTRQSETWPESEQGIAQWGEPGKATSLVHEQELKTLITAFADRIARASAKSVGSSKSRSG